MYAYCAQSGILNPLLTTEATSSPQLMTDLLNNTTAMPAVLWTDWMNSSRKTKRNRGGKRVRKVCPNVVDVVSYFSFKIRALKKNTPTTPTETPLSKALLSLKYCLNLRTCSFTKKR